MKKNVLVIGMARSGIAAAPVLKSLGARVTLNDSKKELSGLENLNKDDYIFRLGMAPDSLIDENDLIVVSPSVPLNLPYAEKAKAQGKEVIAEIICFQVFKIAQKSVLCEYNRHYREILHELCLRNSCPACYNTGNFLLCYLVTQKLPIIFLLLCLFLFLSQLLF